MIVKCEAVNVMILGRHKAGKKEKLGNFLLTKTKKRQRLLKKRKIAER